MRRIVIGGLASVIIISVAFYTWLGGFQSEKITEQTNPERIVYGTYYQGKYGDLRLREIVVKTKQLLNENQVAGSIIVINYDSTATSENINQLIGIAGRRESSEEMQSLSSDTLPAGEYLRVHLYGHPVVRSTPEQIHQKIQKYAEKQQLTLGKEVIEYYFDSDSMWIEYPFVRKI